MMNEEEKYELFDSYLQKELSEQDRLNFESQLAADANLREELEVFTAITGHLEGKLAIDPQRQALLDSLTSLSQQAQEQKETKVIRFKPWKFAVAASIVLLAGVFVFNQFSNPSYNDFYEPQTISLVERGDTDENLIAAEKAFNAKDYEEALRNFDKVLVTEEGNTEIQFYKGIALLELDKFQEAEALFEVISKGNSIFKHQAQWQWALSKLKQKDYEACKKLLQDIPADAEVYEKAQKLLRKL